MKNKNALTVSPASGLPELKRANRLIRLTESILGKSITPSRNRTNEHGRKQGYWVERHAHGDVWEGAYKDGEWHGRWVLRWADGVVFEGPYKDGEWHGHWVFRFVGGVVKEGSFVDGMQHGKWVSRDANGDASESCWENGNRIDC